jgi:arachidonate 15-lipoxygenase
MKPCLPSDDRSPAQRRRQIEAARDEYRWNYVYLPPIPLADEVPGPSKPSLAWWAKVGELLAAVAANGAAVTTQQSGQAGLRKAHEQEFATLAKLVKDGKPGQVFSKLGEFIENGVGRIHADDLDGFDVLYQTLRKPVASHWTTSDFYFANLRVAGPNPMMLRRTPAPPPHFAITEALYQATLGDGDTLEAAGKDGRLFLADFAILDELECGTFPHGLQKYLPAPMGLFAVPRGRYSSRYLVPVGIQLRQQPGPDAPVFTPDHGYAWQIAKSMLNAADGNVMQAIEHLARTHLVMEPFAIALHRNLSERHPLHVLLLPHVEGTLNINNAAQSTLVAPGGGVDAVMSGTIGASRAAAAAGWETFRFNDAFVPNALAARGVMDREALPHFPYRDDALLLWKAIHGWVADYLALYYAADADVLADAELQAWIAEVIAPDGGRMKAVGEEGGVQTLAYLRDLVTMLIFTAGPQHAAVNFPQLPLMAYAPFYPLSLFKPPPTTTEGLTLQDWMDALPSLDIAQLQMNLGNLLGGCHYTELGQYPRKALGLTDWFADPRVDEPLARFHAELEHIESVIRVRNTVRPPYEYLMPSRIPNSINI